MPSSSILPGLGALLCAVSLLIGCGGGGGGSDASPAGGGAAPAPATSFDAVSIALVSATSVQGAYAQRQPSDDIAVYVQASGDLHQLDGKAVYVIVEDPDAITGGTASVGFGTQSVPGSNAFVLVRGGYLNKVGHLQGQLKLHACLDTNCASELRGSPLRVPYDITVQQGLELASHEVQVTLPFGAIPPVQSIEAQLPARFTNWEVIADNRVRPAAPYAPQAALTQTEAGKGRVDVQVVPAPPGRYQESLLFALDAATPGGSTLLQLQSVTVTYTVTPNPGLDYVFFPAQASIRVKRGSPAVFQKRIEVYNEGSDFGGLTGWVEYLSSPPGQPLEPWWDDRAQVAFPCPSNCLPPGTYTARVWVTYLKGAHIMRAYWPISMEILP